MILCFNTMRYTFNMLTMMKEKVNTHFSFPLELDMSDYMEKNLIGKERLEGWHRQQLPYFSVLSSVKADDHFLPPASCYVS